ncbi:MAG: hypothetical protein WBN90_12150 [Gammaproteobacteria bacterium]
MKTHPLSRTIVAAMVAISLAGSGSAWADRKNDQRSHGYSQGGHQDKRSDSRSPGVHRDNRRYERSRDGHRDKYYAYNKHRKNTYKRHHYKDSYRPRYYRGHGGRSYYYYDDDDDNDENLLIGLLMGGLVGYAISSAQQDDSYAYESYPQSYPQREVQTAIYPGDSSSASCLQEREYQMKVIVGGRSVDAYGTACLQPDGSWSRGPAKLASQ